VILADDSVAMLAISDSAAPTQKTKPPKPRTLVAKSDGVSAPEAR
jgi:hypothetical protein